MKTSRRIGVIAAREVKRLVTLAAERVAHAENIRSSSFRPFTERTQAQLHVGVHNAASGTRGLGQAQPLERPLRPIRISRVGGDVNEVRDRRALIANNIAHARLQQGLGHNENALAPEFLALGDTKLLNSFLNDLSAM